MDPKDNLSTPFPTRKMLSFEHGLVFSIQIRTQASVADVLTIRGMTREGVFTFRHTTVADGAVQTATFRIPDIPIMVSVVDEGGIFNQGDVFATLTLTAENGRLFELCSGLVYTEKSISYPATNSIDPMPGRGRIKVITGTDRAAGNEIVESVPAGRIWRPMGINFTLVAAAAAASRRVHIRFNDGGSWDLDCFSSIDQIISETKSYSGMPIGAVPDETDADKIIIPIPDNLYLPEAFRIMTRTSNLNAGDNFGAPTMLVEEFLAVPLIV